MKNKKPLASFAPHEIQRFIYPITLAFVSIIAVVMIEHLVNDTVLPRELWVAQCLFIRNRIGVIYLCFTSEHEGSVSYLDPAWLHRDSHCFGTLVFLSDHVLDFDC